MNGALALSVADEEVWLLPERAVFWPRLRMLIIADTHFGKSSIFGMYGVPVPAGTDEADRRRIGRMMQQWGADRLLILGDFLHAPLPLESPDAQALIDWSIAFRPARLHVVAGNHDRGSTPRWRAVFDWNERDLIEPPFRFTHDADAARPGASDEFTFSGHIHPVTRLRGLRKSGPRVPVFWLRPQGLVLPSFGMFTGGYAVRPADEDRLFAVTPERVVAFG